MNIKIFVSHRIDLDSKIVKNEIFTPVYCGAIYKKDKWNDYIIGDNTGDNISEKRKSYCELTVQYWAWKNVEADYYGLCHYRRYFSFSNEELKSDVYGNIIYKYLNDKNIKELNLLNEEKIYSEIKDYDICLTEAFDVNKVDIKNVFEQFYKSNVLEKNDIEILRKIIKDKYPDYIEDMDKYLNNNKFYPCCMFIMKKKVFFEYCDWLFDILSNIEKEIDTNKYNEEKLRTIGHLGERLLGIYYYHCLRTKDIKTKILQRAYFLDTHDDSYLKPAFKNNSIPVVFAANNNFVPMLCTAIHSLMYNANPNFNYDIVVLESDIENKHKNILRKSLVKYNNVSLRFYNALSLIDGFDLKAKNHITVETFFRFLIQKILLDYKKVIYLDCDLVIEEDISKLYSIDINQYYLAATLDPDFIGQVNGADIKTLSYTKNKLNLKDPYKYFQAGVLLLNIANMRKAYTLEEWLKFCLEDYKYSDQDVLNIYCQGKVKYLDMNWNVLHDCSKYRVNYVIKLAPNYIYQEYMTAREKPFIIHFAGFLKPWMNPDEDFGERFWYYAKMTPYYELLLFRMNQNALQNIVDFLDNRHMFKQTLKVIVDKILPRGTKRREIIKRIIPYRFR